MRLKGQLAPASETEENVGVERDAEAQVPPNSDTTSRTGTLFSIPFLFFFLKEKNQILT